MGVALDSFPIKRHLKCRNPALATDTILSDTSAEDSGVKQAQVFVGRFIGGRCIPHEIW